jgi:Raf kinase inhibitor-like YbhB/YbcL family protein
MKLIALKRLAIFSPLILLILPAWATAQSLGARNSFQISSTTFANNGTLPLSMANNIPGANGLNTCSADGSAGGDQSPELSWTRPVRATRSLAVVAYDVTAAFTHWGIYNISPATSGLPENAGVAGSPYGAQIVNDFATAAEYDGPCPPAGVSPVVHQYTFTVYALDKQFTLPSSANFPAIGETLYQALIKAGQDGHILESATISGFYSATP